METKKLRKLNILDENEELNIEHDSNDCVIETDQDIQDQIIYNTGLISSAPIDHINHGGHSDQHYNQPNEADYTQPSYNHNQMDEVFMNNHQQLIYHHRLPPRTQRERQHLGAFV